jgi:hypothetical protein
MALRRLAVAAVLCALATGGVASASGVLSIGDVIPGGKASGSEPSRLAVPETVVATGESQVGGPWLVTSYSSEESASEPAGLPCLRMTLRNPPRVSPIMSSGFCGQLEDDFGAVSLPVVNRGGDSEVMIFGIAPEAGETVELRGPAGALIRTPARSVESEFEGSRVFVMTARQRVAGAELIAETRAGQRLGRAVDATGFFDRLEQVERNASVTPAR